MGTVVASYRQLVRAYPTGGGDYEVASKNIGRSAGVIVASALLVDYVMTVAVSVSSGVDNIISAFPSLNSKRVLMALVFVAVLAAVNLRGIREAGLAFAAPTYLFMTGVFLMIGTGLVRLVVGSRPVAESAHYGIHAQPGYGSPGVLVLGFLVLRAFSSGCTALTGVEAIANGVPAFQPPKAKNAQKTLLMMGIISTSMFAGITALALIAKVHYVDTTCDLTGLPAGFDCSHEAQRTVIAQVASAVFGGAHSIGFFFVQATTALILVLAANTAFNGFPLLGAILARDKNLPRQLHNRGDRLAYSNGILALAIVAGLVIFVVPCECQQADPALRHRRVHLVHPRPVGHGPALESDAAPRTRPGRAVADLPVSDHQRIRREPVRGRAGHRDRHQVHQGRLSGADRDADPLRDHAGDQPALFAGRDRTRDRVPAD